MRERRLAVLLACLPVLVACGSEPDVGADLVLSNAHIYTVNDDAPRAEAVAIRDGRFLYVGDSEGAAKYIGSSTDVIDMGGRFVMPGMIDGHTHPGYIGVERFDGPRLPQTSLDELLAAVKKYADANPGTDWVRMCCWPPHSFVSGRTGPHKRDLDGIVPDRPVWINSRSWHSYWLNSKGLETLGVDENTPDPRAGVAVYDRDENGELTGWIKEGAGWQHFVDQFAVDSAAHRARMEEFVNTLSEYGVTIVYDGGNFGYEDHVYGFLAELERNGKLPLRYEGTFQVFTPERKDIAIREMRRLRGAYGGEKLRFRTIKLFMDGINANRTGAMLQPYADLPDYLGSTMLTTDELRDFLLGLHEQEIDLHVHTIGDLAVRTVLDAVEAAQAAVEGDLYPRVTLAHLNTVHPDDHPRFAELGVSANFTPWWQRMSRGGTGDPVLGDERYSRLFDVKSLFDAGANVTFSSDDWDLDVLNPFLGIQIGHIRQAPPAWLAGYEGETPALAVPGPENPDLDQMIRGYTINGAIPFRMEEEIGSIESGKRADLVILDENPFETDIYAIYELKPRAVMFEGEVIHGELY